MTDTALFPNELLDRAAAVIAACDGSGLALVTAESCTGGLVGGILTEISGASAVIDRGFITYSNEAKRDLLGVPQALLDAHGAVSREVALAMAEGAIGRADPRRGSALSVAVTGIAGPTGGGPGKPVGTVHFATARSGHDPRHGQHRFDGDRTAIRLASVGTALEMLLEMAGFD